MNTPKRNVQVHFMVSEDERAIIKQEMTEVGTINLLGKSLLGFYP